MVSDCLHVTPKYEDEGYPMVRVSEIGNNILNLGNALKVSKENYAIYTSNYKPQNGDIILARVGAFLGQFSLVDTDEEFCIGQNTTIIHPNKMSKYIYYNLISDLTQKRLQREAAGSAYKSVGVDTIKNFEIDIPDERSAELIGSILYKIDRKIQINNGINDNLQQMAYAKYMHMFFSKKPNAKLEDIITENPKSTIQVGDAKNTNGKIPFFTSGDAILRWPDTLVTGRNCYLNTGGNAGVKFYVGNAAYSTDTWCISARDNLSDYLYMLLESIKPELNQKFFQGTGLKHLQKPLLKDRSIYIPELSELKEFNDDIMPWLTMISDNIRESEELVSLRDWLLPMLMNGQATISD